jgi:quercetin dioxygenase-like cupin family protein
MAIHIPPGSDGVVVPHELTGGNISFVEQTMEPRHLIRKHVHLFTDVWIYVLDGEVGVRVGEEEATGVKGSYLLKPRNVPHAMWNPGDVPNRMIEILTPGDGDLFFRDAREMSPDATREDFEAMALRHGIHFFDDWTEELSERYGLT